MLACAQPVSRKGPAKKTTNAPSDAKPPNHPFPPPRSGFVQQAGSRQRRYHAWVGSRTSRTPACLYRSLVARHRLAPLTMSTTQRSLLALGLIAVGAAVFEWHQASQLREQVCSLQEQRDASGEQMQQLQGELEDARGRLSTGRRRSRHRSRVRIQRSCSICALK